jgi:3-hydroxybutyryl-CoA dehydrogenase
MPSNRNRTSRRHERADGVVATQLALAARLPEQASSTPLCFLMPITQLVEITKVLQTSDAVCAAIREVTGTVGDAPDLSQLNYRYVVNRVLVPMINEVINCLYDGLARPKDLDAMVKLGTEPVMGPLALADRIGLDVVLDILDTLYQATDDPKYCPSPALRRLVDAGCLGLKTGQGFYQYDH